MQAAAVRDPQPAGDEVHVQLDGAHAQGQLVGQRQDLVVGAQRRVGLDPPDPREEGAERRVERAVAVGQRHRRVVGPGEGGEAQGQPRRETLLGFQGEGEPGGDFDAPAGADAGAARRGVAPVLLLAVDAVGDAPGGEVVSLLVFFFYFASFFSSDIVFPVIRDRVREVCVPADVCCVLWGEVEGLGDGAGHGGAVYFGGDKEGIVEVDERRWW